MRMISLAGARPNFMKIAPIVRCLEEKNREVDSQQRIEHVVVHSGQHYDASMSDIFLQQLNLHPDIHLSVGSGTHAEQTAKIMMAFEEICVKQKPDLVLVVGDVNTTLAGALVAAKLRIPIAHVEAGLRSFDRSMPEEINRVLTDSVSDLLFITEESAKENLTKEGIPKEKIFFTGNVMIDSLRNVETQLNPDQVLQKFRLQPQDYALVTLHRPESVDHPETLTPLMSVLNEIQKKIRLVFPVHPRARMKMNESQNISYGERLHFLDPLGYPEFISLMKFARFVITDSGGVQEETTALNVPCITVRKATERPITVAQGSNVIAGLDPQKILSYCDQAVRGEWKKASLPNLWDGKAAQRIVNILCDYFKINRS